MKHLFCLLFITSGLYAQQTEFTVYENGLIYNPHTMNRLGAIVDSLNIRFRGCDLSHPYYSLAQGTATWVDVPDKQARKLIASGVTLAKFAEAYPAAVKRNLWMVKSYYKSYRGEAIIRYSGLPGGYTREPKIDLKRKKSNDKISGWILNDDGTEAFWLDTLQTRQLPFAYARLVQYVDCMIDTNATVYFPKAEGSVYGRVDEDSKAAAFVAWAGSFAGKPAFPSSEGHGKNVKFDSAYRVYKRELRRWDSLRMLHVDRTMQTDPYYQKLFAAAVKESLAENNSDRVFESYVLRYGSKEDALRLMRGRKVIGGCSQDRSPRYHAMNICRLAAETTQWDIFLRSHLDIMNDRFERMSDGSYAYQGRKTYLQELEALNIPAVDLLLGTTLRVSNVNDNHYAGAINRTGRALADARNKAEVETRMTGMMQNDQLDMFNRTLMVYLFDNYVSNLQEPEHRNDAARQLEAVVKTMPQEIQDAWSGAKRKR